MNALIFIQIKEGASPIDVAEQISKFDIVKEVLLISGQWDLMIKISYDKMDEMSEFIVNKLRGVEGVSKTESDIVLQQIK